jgi:hypothetical protein
LQPLRPAEVGSAPVISVDVKALIDPLIWSNLKNSPRQIKLLAPNLKVVYWLGRSSQLIVCRILHWYFQRSVICTQVKRSCAMLCCTTYQ